MSKNSASLNAENMATKRAKLSKFHLTTQISKTLELSESHCFYSSYSLVYIAPNLSLSLWFLSFYPLPARIKANLDQFFSLIFGCSCESLKRMLRVAQESSWMDILREWESPICVPFIGILRLFSSISPLRPILYFLPLPFSISSVRWQAEPIWVNGRRKRRQYHFIAYSRLAVLSYWTDNLNWTSRLLIMRMNHLKEWLFVPPKPLWVFLSFSARMGAELAPLWDH